MQRSRNSDRERANQPGAVNGGITSPFQIEPARPAVADPKRSAHIQ